MEDYSYIMDANGMEKFVIMLTSMLFMIENKLIEEDTAYGVKWDIIDFETGDYDCLFSQEDLAQIRKDIKTVNQYLSQNKKLTKEVEREREKAQIE